MVSLSVVRKLPSPEKPEASEPVQPRELARLAAAGDTAATAKLLQSIAPEMMRVVRGVMGTHTSDSDDAMQQSLIALIQGLPAFRGDCEPAGYACRIAFRTALAARKRVHLQRRRHDDDANFDAMSDTRGGDAHRWRRTDLIRSLLDEIPEEQAEALTMRTMLGWSLEEIAESSGAPLNTIRSRLRLAKEALRRKIEADPALAEELGVEP